MIDEMDTTRSPEEIESQIAHTRASLDAKIHELERRLSPREQMARMRSQFNPESFYGLIAAGAVATGAALAFRGWRRFHNGNGMTTIDEPMAAEMMGE